MKKIIGLLLVGIMCFGLVGCGDGDSGDSGGVPTKVKTETLEVEKDLGITAEDVLEIISSNGNTFSIADETSLDEFRYTSIDSEYNTVKVKCYSLAETDSLSVVMVASKNANSVVESLYNNTVNRLNDELKQFQNDQLKIDDVYVTAFFAENSELQHDKMPLVIKPESDFLLDGEIVDTIESYAFGMDYEGLIEVINEYINKNSPAEDDNAYKIKEICQNASATLDSCYIVTDEFESTKTIYGNNVTEISSETVFVPSFTPSQYSPLSGSVDYNVGFQKSGWLFFDELKLKIDDNEPIGFGGSDTQTNILSGGNIEERLSRLDSSGALEEIANSDSAVFRFTNTDTGENYERTVSSNEKLAAQNLFSFVSNINELNSLIIEWNKTF